MYLPVLTALFQASLDQLIPAQFTLPLVLKDNVSSGADCFYDNCPMKHVTHFRFCG